MSNALTSGLTLMRRVPPSECEKGLAGLAKLVPDEETVDQFYQRVDKPLSLGKCESTGHEFILCEFNRDGDSYRSPWSNEYQPPMPEAVLPSETLRQLEVKANQVFQEYTRLYYQGGVSSVYFWDTNPNEFACSFLIKKEVEGSEKASWESSNLVSAKLSPESKSVTYTVTSTVLLQIETKDEGAGDVGLSGTVSRQMQDTKPLEANVYGESHIYNMISLVETMEGRLRTALDQIYIGKTQEILDRSRKMEDNLGPRVQLIQ